MFTFNHTYFLLTLALFFIEVCIALFVHDRFIRPYLGDVLVVILMYCFVKSFLKISVIQAALGVLCFAICIEAMQYLGIVEILGWQKHKLAKTVIGTSFSWEDLLMYGCGFLTVLFAERYVQQKKTLQ